jgi:signal transduction histidine kinase
VSFAAMTPLRRALLGIGAAGLLMGAVLFPVVATSGVPQAPVLEACIGLLLGWSFIGTGLYAWDRRPSNLVGPLMVCVGFSWFLSDLKSSDVEVLFAVGGLCNSLPIAFLIHLLVVFPGGRARGRADRLFIAYAYVAGAIVAVVPNFFYDTAADSDCGGCPSNPILIHGNNDLVFGIYNGLSAVSVVAIGALIVHLVRRARTAAPAERRSQEPVWWAGGATLFLIAASLLTNLGPEGGDYDDIIWYIGLVVLSTVPYAFLFGLLRTKLSEADVVAEENVRLDAELQARLDELRESRARIVRAGDAARRKLERDLHDGAQQRLVGLALDLRLAREKLGDDPEAAAAMLDDASADLARATEELRELARGIHPAVLSDRGLDAAVQVLAQRTPLPVRVDSSLDDRLPGTVEAAAYFVIAEALTNVVKHSGANRAEVGMRRDNGRLRVEIRDDGAGGADVSGSGLRGLADRLAALDGRLEVQGRAPGGTIVRADIPLRSGER